MVGTGTTLGVGKHLEAGHFALDIEQVSGQGVRSAGNGRDGPAGAVAKNDNQLHPEMVDGVFETSFANRFGNVACITDDEEIAQALDISIRTVRRDWQRARLLLAAALR